MLFEKDGKRDSGTEWRIYYFCWRITVFLTAAIDPSLMLRMTLFVLRHYDAFRSPLLVTSFPKIVIQSFGKNTVWESREAAIWYKAKNLSLWWQLTIILIMPANFSHSFGITFYRFPYYDSRFFANTHNDALPSPSVLWLLPFAKERGSLKFKIFF